MNTDNPPAFPVPPGAIWFTGDPRDGAGYEPSQEGMTLRDYFAGQALVSIIQQVTHPAMGKALIDEAARSGVGTLEPVIAMQAYNFADAMLAARGKEGA